MERFDGLHSMNVTELTTEQLNEVNGGFWQIVVGVVGVCAGVAYLYEFGYNMVDKAFANSKQK